MANPTASTIGVKMKSSMSLCAQYSREGPLFEVLARIPAQPDELAEVWRSVDPAQVAESAARHGLSAWLVDALAAARVEPNGRLLADARVAVSAAHRLRRLTLAVFDALAKAGVVPIALKGSVLAQRVYPMNPLCRPSSDVDVLVTRAQLDTVATALAPLGLLRMVDASLGDVFEDHHHLSFSGAAGLVEAHFRLISSFGGGLFDDASVRQRAVPQVFDGRRVLVLAPEDEFIYLATHAANHAFLRLSWLVDLQQFLRLWPDLDFGVMAARAADAGFLQAVTVALHLLERRLQVQLPATASQAFGGRRLRGWVDAQLFSPQRLESASFASHRLGSFAARLLMVDSAGHGARHLVDGMKRLARRSFSTP